LIPLFDLHCDTLYEIYKRKENIKDNSLQISFKKAQIFSKYLQVGAIWSDFRLSNDEAYENCLRSIKYAKSQEIHLLDKVDEHSNSGFILAVEDARLLNGHIERLLELYSIGVKALTLNWKDNSCIGGGWNTNFPLTNFGKNVVFKSCEIGMTIDLSHSSEEVFWDALKICESLGKSPIASHSNAYKIQNHKRNLNDEQIKAICANNGLIGICLATEHLGKNADIDTVIKHIDHFLRLGCADCLSLGCDFDGVTSLPHGINSIEDLNLLFYRIEEKFGNKIAKKIFFENAFSYFKSNMRKEL
jgi:membrane dipeptidase